MKKTIVLVLLALFFFYALVVAKKTQNKILRANEEEEEADSEQCGCSWANAGTCGTNDGSVCNIQCCAPYRTSTTTTTTTKSSSNCGCSWANAGSCATNDGTVCNIECCAPFRGGSTTTTTTTSGSWRTGVTTRYWDCCKPSCAWPSNLIAGTSGVVRSCNKDGVSIAPSSGINVCGGGGYGGPNYMCNNQQPFTKNGKWYGFVASNVDCCTCYELQFTSGPVAGKSMFVQVTNKGGDLGTNHFDIQIPGGGVGIFTSGCPAQFGTWNGGAQYGGVSSASGCAGLPASLQAGCYWRFNEFKNADNPSVRFQRITCPSELTSITGCSA